MNNPNSVWQTIEEINGTFLGFRYEIRRIDGVLWNVTAIYPRKGKPIKITKVANSPGEAMDAMARAVFDLAPVERYG